MITITLIYKQNFNLKRIEIFTNEKVYKYQQVLNVMIREDTLWKKCCKFELQRKITLTSNMDMKEKGTRDSPSPNNISLFKLSTKKSKNK